MKFYTYTEAGMGGFAIEQTLRDATLAVFSFANFKTASAYLCVLIAIVLITFC
ncbi:MAG: hypothetical protein LBH59_01300 [Planctomycetaceae bacterium]|nr:hypothetical protein [Planctomycetaceae bacterium]